MGCIERCAYFNQSTRRHYTSSHLEHIGTQRKNAPIGAQKRLIYLKQKDLIAEMGLSYLPQTDALITSANNSWPPHVPFHTALKIPQPEHIHALSTWLTIKNSHRKTHTHIDKNTNSHIHSHTLTHTDTHTHTLTHTGIWIRKREYVRLRNF